MKNKKLYFKPIISVNDIYIEDVILASKVTDKPLDIFDNIDEEL